MKKIFLALMLISVLFLTGCGKLNDKDIRSNFVKDVNGLKGYYMEGSLSIINNDDTFTYDVKVSYQKEDLFKVILINKNNSYEQTILRNKDGVFVVTPSLNKSFKFQSEWPYNNSQAYLLQSVAKDLENDKEYKFEQKNKDYIFTTKVNYPNNPKFVKQNITLDSNYNLKKVEVLDDKGIAHLIFTVANIDKKPTFDNKYFTLESITTEEPKTETKPETENQEKPNNNSDINNSDTNNNSENNTPNQNESTNPTITIDENIFPLYLPNNTALANKETIDTNSGQRVIMTFSGEKPFIFVQETVSKEKELTIIPTYGEPFMLIDTVGSLTDMSYTWTSNGIEYYIVSDVMNRQELLEVAKSINVIPTLNEK